AAIPDSPGADPERIPGIAGNPGKDFPGLGAGKGAVGALGATPNPRIPGFAGTAAGAAGAAPAGAEPGLGGDSESLRNPVPVLPPRLGAIFQDLLLLLLRHQILARFQGFLCPIPGPPGRGRLPAIPGHPRSGAAPVLAGPDGRAQRGLLALGHGGSPAAPVSYFGINLGAILGSTPQIHPLGISSYWRLCRDSRGLLPINQENVKK
ncbi:collagen alpha-1(IV) chain-like, partial [Neopelma chrysocephalum]|uniref:collagen alpha-1(IV) chain-like n=1 Tax=Neopelma chrysocephalum TaxID=114329 RepID=UPI000FCD3EA1